jgi:hypothetical protein
VGRSPPRVHRYKVERQRRSGDEKLTLTESSRTALLPYCLSAVLLAGVTCLAAAQTSNQKCTGDPDSVVGGPATSQKASSKASESVRTKPSKPRTIGLTWNPSVPASTKPQDAVAGYFIFRNESGMSCDQPGSKCKPLNPTVPIVETSCIDYAVKSGHTYTYQTRAVSKGGARSAFSNAATAKLP